MEIDVKQYFLPGDIVTIRQNIPNKPTMLVDKKVTKKMRIGDTSSNYFQGISCKWFTKEGLLQESIFNTKDLIKV